MAEREPEAQGQKDAPAPGQKQLETNASEPITAAGSPLGAIPKDKDDSTTGDGKQTTKRSKAEQGPWQWPPIGYVRAEICVAVAIAAFTAVQAWYGQRQWDATEKQWNAMLTANEITNKTVDAANRSNEIARLASLAQLKAYITVDKATITGRDKSSISLVIQVKNSGQTPAYAMTVETAHDFVEPPHNKTLRAMGVNPPANVSKIIVGAGCEALHPVILTIAPEKMVLLEGGKTRLWVFGEVLYEDFFHKHHWTRYCLFGEGKPNAAGGGSFTDLIFAPEGNDADRE